LSIFFESAFDDDDLRPDIWDLPVLVVAYLLLMEVAHLSGELVLVRCNENTPPTLDGLINRELFYLKSSGSVLRLII
jgi:hypothetical protein